MDRRTILGGVAVAGVAAGAGLVAWTYHGKAGWTDASMTLRRPIPPGLTGQAALAELVRCATLAPNSHNTQAWRFRLSDGAITITPDFARRTPIVDPDDHHLYVSLGAAAETIVQAAPMVGLVGTATYLPAGDGAIQITLAGGERKVTPQAAAIFRRQSTRSLYDGRSVPVADLHALITAAHGPDDDGVEVLPIIDRAAVTEISAIIVAANAAQFDNPAFTAELKHWLRFSYPEALRSRDGLFAVTTGNPALPAGLGRTVFDLLVSADSEGRKCHEQIASSAGLAIFLSERDDRARWVAAGRAFQRFALQATVLGIRLALVNQAVEVPAFRRRLAMQLGRDGARPDLVVRFGYASDMAWSLRRPVAEVLA